MSAAVRPRGQKIVGRSISLVPTSLVSKSVSHCALWPAVWTCLRLPARLSGLRVPSGMSVLTGRLTITWAWHPSTRPRPTGDAVRAKIFFITLAVDDLGWGDLHLLPMALVGC